MDYKQKYEQALERARNIRFGNPQSVTANVVCEEIFPELKESEDERIRKVLVDFFKDYIKNTSMYLENVDVRAILAWLEKQGEFTDKEEVLIGARKGIALSIMNFLDRNTLGMCLSNMECKDSEDAVVDSDWSKVYNYMKKKLEKQSKQKPTDKVEPKFKIGDYIVNEYGFIMQIDGIDGNMYVYHLLYGNVLLKHDITKTEESCHLWTIKDAKDGDVLANKYGVIFINAGNSKGRGTLDCYCYISVQNEFCIEEHKTGSWLYKDDIKPTTKEQRDFLFQKMKEAGYGWDAEKKELKKISQEYPLTPDECIKPIVFSEQKPTWSEKDEKMLDRLIKHFDWGSDYRFDKNDCDEAQDWLKSLKQRMKGE